jgi:hypothetical protein
MPGGRPRLTFFAAAAVVGALLVTGCAATEHHTWQGEFTERLEGASAAIEAKLPEMRSGEREDELFRAGSELGRTLESKYELIEKLDPPEGCEAVEQGGRGAIGGTAELSRDLFMNLTPYLRRHLHRDIEERLTEMKGVEHEAAHCESA